MNKYRKFSILLGIFSLKIQGQKFQSNRNSYTAVKWSPGRALQRTHTGPAGPRLRAELRERHTPRDQWRCVHTALFAMPQTESHQTPPTVEGETAVSVGNGIPYNDWKEQSGATPNNKSEVSRGAKDTDRGRRTPWVPSSVSLHVGRPLPAGRLRLAAALEHTNGGKGPRRGVWEPAVSSVCIWVDIVWARLVSTNSLGIHLLLCTCPDMHYTFIKKCFLKNKVSKWLDFKIFHCLLGASSWTRYKTFHEKQVLCGKGQCGHTSWRGDGADGVGVAQGQTIPGIWGT